MLNAAFTHPDNPEPWDFSKHPAADLVVINIGTNDNNAENNVSTEAYIDALTKIIQGVHGKWPNAQVIVMVSYPNPGRRGKLMYELLLVPLAGLLPVWQYIPPQRPSGLGQ